MTLLLTRNTLMNVIRLGVNTAKYGLLPAVAMYAGLAVAQSGKYALQGKARHSAMMKCNIGMTNGTINGFTTRVSVDTQAGSQIYARPQDVVNACADKIARTKLTDISWVYVDGEVLRNGKRATSGIRDTYLPSAYKTSAAMAASIREVALGAAEVYSQRTDKKTMLDDFVVAGWYGAGRGMNSIAVSAQYAGQIGAELATGRKTIALSIK